MEKSFALTVLSNGAGQDTTWLIEKLVEDKEFYKKHVEGDLIIVGGDTGDEHEWTYKNIERLRKLCLSKGIVFMWITPDMGFHSQTWPSLTEQYKRTSSIGSPAFRQTCTDKLKIKVVDNFVESFIKKYYGCRGTRKQAYHDFYEKYGKIKLLLGFAKGEESRTVGAAEHDPVWKKKLVRRFYPLIEEGISRQDCIDYFEARGLEIMPSNCKRCFYQSLQEILWLNRNLPEDFQEWVDMEDAKIKKWENVEGVTKNYGVYGKKLLPQKLAEAKEKFGHMTNEELHEYKKSHGHCIKSKY